jgi:hypothetical protein
MIVGQVPLCVSVTAKLAESKAQLSLSMPPALTKADKLL